MKSPTSARKLLQNGRHRMNRALLIERLRGIGTAIEGLMDELYEENTETPGIDITIIIPKEEESHDNRPVSGDPSAGI